MAAHASTRTTQLYDRREDRVTLDEVVKINIRGWPPPGSKCLCNRTVPLQRGSRQLCAIIGRPDRTAWDPAPAPDRWSAATDFKAFAMARLERRISYFAAHRGSGPGDAAAVASKDWVRNSVPHRALALGYPSYSI